MKKRKLKYKKLLIALLIFIIFLILPVFYFIFKTDIQFKKNNMIEINSKIHNTSLITKIKHGKLISKKKPIDTSKLGNTTITFKVRKFNKLKKYQYTIKIVDTTKPIIKYQKHITINVGDDIDLLSNVKVTDNSKEKIEPKIDGKYDLNKVGTYKLWYIATDSSGNKTKKKFTLEVKKQKESNSSKTANGHSLTLKDGVTYIDGVLIANKTYALPSTYNPGKVTDEVMTYFNQMSADATSVGLKIFIVSGFRSYDTQTTLYNNYVNRDGKEEADTYSARPGHSEHQSGLAFDLNLVDQSFENTNEFKWLNENAYRYGFVLRYPKGKTSETGYIYEAWHFRYVGEELAKKIYNNGNWITLENYFGITSEYNY